MNRQIPGNPGPCYLKQGVGAVEYKSEICKQYPSMLFPVRRLTICQGAHV